MALKSSPHHETTQLESLSFPSWALLPLVSPFLRALMATRAAYERETRSVSESCETKSTRTRTRTRTYLLERLTNSAIHLCAALCKQNEE